MKILFVTTSLPHLAATGAEVCSMNFISALQNAGHAVTVLGYLRPGDAGPSSPIFHAVETRPIEIADAGSRRYGWMLKSMVTGRPFICEKFKSPAMVNTIRRAVDQNEYDLLIIDHAQMGWILDLPFLPIRKVFIAHNFEAELYEKMARTTLTEGSAKQRLYLRDAALIRQIETRLCQAVDQVWTVTKEEATAFAALVPGAQTRPFALPGAEIRTQRAVRAKRDISILGAWSWDINRAGLIWFMDEVVPLLPKAIQIGIAGKNAHLVPNPHPNVTYHGFVDDAGAFLASGRTILLPTVAGAGVQLKTIAALASGVPVIGTELAFRGLGPLPEIARAVPQNARILRDAILTQLGKAAHHDPESGRAWFDARRAQFDADVSAALAQLQLANSKSAAPLTLRG